MSQIPPHSHALHLHQSQAARRGEAQESAAHGCGIGRHRAKAILSEHKEGHARLAELLVEREVIFAEDVENIFGKRPWASRAEELLEAQQKAQAEAMAERRGRELEAQAAAEAEAKGGSEDAAKGGSATATDEVSETSSTAVEAAKNSIDEKEQD